MFCQLTAIGRLGRDPEKSDRGPCRFSVATTRTYTKDGEKVEETEWVTVVVWGNQAEPCAKYLKKGRLVTVVGHLKTSSFEKDGVTKYKTECIADRVIFMPEGKREASSDSEGESTGLERYAPQDPGDTDDIPF